MALYDIIDEIVGKQVTKSDTGDARIFGAMIGVVAKNYDKDMPGRVCVAIPTREKKANELQWARLALVSGGKEWGHYFMPEVGDQVLLVFEGGNIEKPYIVGCVSKDGDKFLTGSVDENNQTKRIVTKNGSTLIFEDHKSSDDKDNNKDKITLSTATAKHTLLLDNENNIITLTDKKKENRIQIKTKDGDMSIKAKSKVTIAVGDKIKLILNGESGAVSLKCEQLNVESSEQVKVKGGHMLKAEAAQITQTASSGYKVESSGMVNIAGSTIKIG
ncbi:MAG: phage baseplate assembly protein V [Clostridiales Family XIII bacterium]|jgi:uncharacterized protein involved in type VI secretion and phage assembly|nr:phage baseplate assembly protein V [Clostridiales Family XIII bacterium]